MKNILHNDIRGVIFCQMINIIYEGAYLEYHRGKVKTLNQKNFYISVRGS